MRAAALKQRRRSSGGVGLGFYISATLLVVLSIAPILWVLKMSIVPKAELFASPPPLLPRHPTLSSYDTIFSDPTFVRGLLNSVLIAGSTTFACLLLGAPAAYAFARLRFRFRTFLMTGILALAFFPAVAVIAPLFIEFKTFQLLNSYGAVIITDTVFVLPLTVWIMSAFFRQLPRDLEDAAKVDGASTWHAFRKVILPIAAPGVATAAIIAFIVTWNEFLFANTFLFDSDHWPSTVVIPNFATTHSVDYGAQAAAALVITVPIALVVLAFQRRIVQGLTAGALKG
ncbi:MAG: trehalose/maltose transport system permease protein [Solirubrobacteraceae bacterium]|jgi:ABC-type glycerol-3-phosphate transport system permease component|nr:trehalose/maltose transport system permease protein [Solirubrobacteraceae bacterium]